MRLVQTGLILSQTVARVEENWVVRILKETTLKKQ